MIYEYSFNVQDCHAHHISVLRRFIISGVIQLVFPIQKKASLEHEEIFDKIRAISIPLDRISLLYVRNLWSRLNGLVSIAFNNPESIVDWNTLSYPA